VRRPRTIRIGVVVPLSSLLSDCDTPAELADRSGFIPGEALKEQIAAALDADSRDEILFTRLLTDDGGRLQPGSVLPTTPPREDLAHYDGQPASPTAGARAQAR
jgi:hypothetical protein